MSATSQCYRHPRGTWIANCSDCTDWYLAAAHARRDAFAGTELAQVRILAHARRSAVRLQGVSYQAA